MDMRVFSVSPPRGSSRRSAATSPERGAAGVGGLNPPVWVPDAAVSECVLCLASFGLFRRKHHCRACGKIFCGACSRHQSTIPELGYFRPTRVCNLCVQRASSRDTPPHSTKKPAFPRSPALTRRQRGHPHSGLRFSQTDGMPFTPSAGGRSSLRSGLEQYGGASDAGVESEQICTPVSSLSAPPRQEYSECRKTIGPYSVVQTGTQIVPTTPRLRLWLPDAAAGACHECNASFSAHRRHHCRSCQRVFCHACSSCAVSPHRLVTTSIKASRIHRVGQENTA